MQLLNFPTPLCSRPSPNPTLGARLCNLKAAQTENVWVTVGALLQRNQRGFLIEGSRVVVAQIRFVRTGSLQPGHWTRASCIMEPFKRVSAHCLEMHSEAAPPPALPLHFPLPSIVFIYLLVTSGISGETLTCPFPNFASHQRSAGASFCALMSPLSAQRPWCWPHHLMRPTVQVTPSTHRLVLQ